jgi:GTP:adenosylcobinamide-phosphate guanylyltransferase
VARVTARWTAILLAGQRPGEDQLAAGFGVALKPLIPVVGRAMVERVVATLAACPDIARILVLTQSPDAIVAALPDYPAVTVRASGDGIARSVAAVAGGPEARWPVLVTTADHVLLTPETVADFLAQADGCDVAFALVERRTVLARFPATRRTWLRFAGGAYTGANLFALNRPAAAAALAMWSDVEADRKKGWRLLARFGPVILLRALTRTIGLHEAIARAGARLGIVVKPVILGDARAAVDVDKLADHTLATAVLEGRA